MYRYSRLHQGNSLPVGLQSMKNRAMSECRFTAAEYYRGTDETVAQNDQELFGELWTTWKENVDISEEEKKKWLNNIHKWICQRTDGIMENNKRNYYGECASFISALGEVMESFGNKGAKTRLLEEYRCKYSRRRAFHEELCRYGMKK